MTDADYMKVLKSMIYMTDPTKCWMIGSSPLVILSEMNNMGKTFNNENFSSRDIDFTVNSKLILELYYFPNRDEDFKYINQIVKVPDVKE